MSGSALDRFIVRTPLPEAPRRRKRDRRWFGVVPRWLGWAVLVGLVLAGLAFGAAPAIDPPPGPQALEAIDGLRTTSVYVAPGAPAVVDATRARRAIGDRPIVVAMLDRTRLPHAEFTLERQNLCEDIAKLTPTNIVILFAADSDGDYDSSFCTGEDFPHKDDFDFPLIAEAEAAWTYRVTDTDKTAQIEEYVLAFDAQAAKSFAKEVPRRAVIKPPPPAPSPLQAGQITLAIGGLVLAVVSLFALLKLVGHWYDRRVARRTEERSEHAELSARLSRLADVVLHPERAEDAADAARQAEVARRYVLVLQEFEEHGAAADVVRDVAELEEAVS
jgi:hypothetical protein